MRLRQKLWKYNTSFLFITGLLLTLCLPLCAYEQKTIPIIIVGYGGRAQWLLMRCLQERNDIKVLAICDEKAQECLDHMKRECNGPYASLKEIFNTTLTEVELYPDSIEAIRLMLEKYRDVKEIWITSRNDRHFDQLTTILQYSSCPKIFMEKPLFRTLEELSHFDWRLANNREIVLGLTLRYSSMAFIVAKQLQHHKEKLGALRSVKTWERLSFSHALHSFVLANRRYRSLWGGLLLEKSIHDIDLALFFISATGFTPSRILLNTTTENKFFTHANLPQILEYCGNNPALENRVTQTLKDGFNNTDLIPDYHKFSATLFAEGYDPIKFELETDMSSYRSIMERGSLLTFEHGQILVDIMASCMTISLNDETTSTYDLKTLYGGHADGDMYVIHAILNDTQPNEHLRVTLSDPIARLANLIALVSEEQSLHQYESQELIYLDDFWILRDRTLPDLKIRFSP